MGGGYSREDFALIKLWQWEILHRFRMWVLDNNSEVHQKIDMAPTFDFGTALEVNSSHRSKMEDAVVAIGNFGGVPGDIFVAVYDGHGGDLCSKFAQENLHVNLLDLMKCSGPDVTPGDMLVAAYLRTDEQMKEKGLGRQCGTTAVTCWIRQNESGEKQLYTANVGDSRAVIRHGSTAFRLSRDHKATDHSEANRIKAAGGFISAEQRALGTLMVTRALGHGADKEFISGTPFVSNTILDEQDSLLLLASDGVWDAFRPERGDQDAVDFVEKQLLAGVSTRVAAEKLVAWCLGSMDNISAIVVNLKTTTCVPIQVKNT